VAQMIDNFKKLCTIPAVSGNEKAIRDYIVSQQACHTIPPKDNASEPWPVDSYTYKERHLVECFFQKIKWFRRIFTRYDKLDNSFLALVLIASIVVLLI
jgi:transposase